MALWLSWIHFFTRSKTLVLSCLAWSSTWKNVQLFLLLWQRRCCDVSTARVTEVPVLQRSLTLPLFLRPSLASVCGSCLSLSVSLLLFWHLHAVKVRQEKKRALAASTKTKSALWSSIMQTSKSVDLVYFSSTETAETSQMVQITSAQETWLRRLFDLSPLLSVVLS